MKLKIVLEKGEDGFIVAHCPSLIWIFSALPFLARIFIGLTIVPSCVEVNKNQKLFCPITSANL